MKSTPILTPIVGLLFSRKFLVMLFAALASYGLDVSPEFQAVLFALGAMVFQLATAWEDRAKVSAEAEMFSAEKYNISQSAELTSEAANEILD